MICTNHHRALLGSNKGDVACTGEKRNAYKLLAEKPEEITSKTYTQMVG
jgi:hypothetical protein